MLITMLIGVVSASEEPAILITIVGKTVSGIIAPGVMWQWVVTTATGLVSASVRSATHRGLGVQWLETIVPLNPIPSRGWVIQRHVAARSAGVED